MRVQQLDFGPQGRDEGQAKAALIDQVITDPEQADLVWARLTALMLSNAAGRRAIDRTGLAQTLANAQVRVRQLASVRDDIARLADPLVASTSRLWSAVSRVCSWASRKASTNWRSALPSGEPSERLAPTDRFAWI